MRKTIIALSVLLLAALPGAAQQKTEKTLYQRLGGYDAIAAVVDDLLPRAVGDPQLGPFFKGHSNDSNMRTRQLIVDLVCQKTGGPCLYTGRSLKTAHEGIGLTDAHWNLLVNHLKATLDKFKVPPKEQGELLAIISATKADIVAAPAGAGKK